MGYFEHVERLPADPILELMWEFKRDPRKEKIDLSVGIYYDHQLKNLILPSVKEAEQRLYQEEQSKSYLPIDGDPVFNLETQRLILGAQLMSQLDQRCYTTQTVGGTGALRVGADFLFKTFGKKIFVPQPTWENHHKIFHAAGLEVKGYPYYNMHSHDLDFDKMKEFLMQIEDRSIILLHACCHNPTGSDLTHLQWKELSEVVKTKGHFPFFDMAYLGFGDGVEEDSFGVRYFAGQGHQMLVAFSYAKICGLYAERVGALTLVCENEKERGSCESLIKVLIRSNYSNPPKHGAKIVSVLLSNQKLREMWQNELSEMRERIQMMRDKFAKALIKECRSRDYTYLLNKKGMFCFSGLNGDQVHDLKEKQGIYMTKTGRVNLTGLNQLNLPIVVDAIKKSVEG